MCPRCLALRPAVGDGVEAGERRLVCYPATWSIIFITIVTSIVGCSFRESVVPFGAAISWRMIGGNEWWRLLTSFFVHKGFDHAFSNLFLLWIVGKRLERILGTRGFLGVYLMCGLTSSVVSLAFSPERTCFGASGAVFGVTAAVIAIYSFRFRTLTGSQKWRFAFLVFYTVGSLVAGLYDQETDNPGHLGGVVSGLVLGVLFAIRFAPIPVRQVRVFAGMGVILLAACIWIRLTHSYLTHVNAAERALNHREYDDAARELQIALAMKPGSRAAHDFAMQLEAERTPRVNYCAALEPETSDLAHSVDPCGGKQCDGRLRTFTAPGGSTAYYVGTVMSSTPLVSNGPIEKEITANVMMQTLDESGEIGCTVKWSRVSRQKVDSLGNPIAGAVVMSESSGTVSVFDPQAESLHQLILAAR